MVVELLTVMSKTDVLCPNSQWHVFFFFFCQPIQTGTVLFIARAPMTCPVVVFVTVCAETVFSFFGVSVFVQGDVAAIYVHDMYMITCTYIYMALQ